VPPRAQGPVLAPCYYAVCCNEGFVDSETSSCVCNGCADPSTFKKQLGTTPGFGLSTQLSTDGSIETAAIALLHAKLTFRHFKPACAVI
jgi:hypothetical protein